MAIYHLTAQMITRSKGRSSVAAAAYRSGETLTNERDGVTHYYSRKRGISYTDIMTPDGAPAWARQRERLWNEVERAETRINSQTARELEIALPRELALEEHKWLLHGFVQEQFVNRGMVADLAIHDTHTGNPHAHVMLTTREVDGDGFTVKNRDWNHKETLQEWRSAWASHCNRALADAGSAERVDHRSFEVRGIDQVPQVHQGVAGAALIRRGEPSRVGDAQGRADFRNAFKTALHQGTDDAGKIRQADEHHARHTFRKIGRRERERVQFGTGFKSRYDRYLTDEQRAEYRR